MIRRLGKQAGRVWGPRLPESWGRLPYAGALAALETALCRTSWIGAPVETWARNSYVLKTLVPFSGDLDLTLWFPSPPSGETRVRVKGVLIGARHAFPWMGETNAYDRPTAEALAPLANAFELARDPELRRRLEGRTDSPLDLRAQACAFLLRMLEGDLDNVRHRPEERRRKWESHFDAVRSTVRRKLDPPWTGATLERGILELAARLLEPGDETSELAIADSLERYFELAARRVSLHRVLPEPLWTRMLPHRFPTVAEGSFPGAPDRVQCLLEAQLAWEIWGIFGQKLLAIEAEEFQSHVATLQARIAALPPADQARPGAEAVASGLRCLLGS